MMIHTSNEEVLEFLKRSKANKEQVDISTASEWCCAMVENQIVGVIGIIHGQHTDRIKGFFVEENHRKCGIGTELLREAIIRTKSKRVTAFCTRNSEQLFLNEGFHVVREQNKYGISFVELKK